MTETGDILVQVDDRARLISAVLAATTYPENAQQTKPHGTHAHARATRKRMDAWRDHPAVTATQQLLDQKTPLETLYGLVMQLPWPDVADGNLPSWAPEAYHHHLQDFYATSDLAGWWEQEQSAWDKTIIEAQNALGSVQFKAFLAPFLGDIRARLIFMPNISYPTDQDIGFYWGDDLVCIAPPPMAWGDNPPWPYDEPTMIAYVYRTAMIVYGRMLLKAYLTVNAEEMPEITKHDLPLNSAFKTQYPTWEEQFNALFLSAAVAMYLEDHVDDREFRAYMLMEKKARGLVNLPGTVSVLRRYLQEVGNGKYNNLIEFMPYFAKQLRVAQRMVKF